MILQEHPDLLLLSTAEMLQLASELQEEAERKVFQSQKLLLEEALQKGLDDIEEGRFIPGDRIKARMDSFKSEWLAQQTKA